MLGTLSGIVISFLSYNLTKQKDKEDKIISNAKWQESVDLSFQHLNQTIEEINIKIHDALKEGKAANRRIDEMEKNK